MNNNNPESEDRNVELSISEVQSSDPNQPVTIDVEAPSNDLAERMENAFDRNLDNLIKDVQAPPPPVKLKKPKKVKQVKVKKTKIKISRYQPISGGSEKSFALFLGRKIASSFSLAATARKNAKASGEPARKAGYFLKQALGFEFGGDLINRTRGSFSSDPTEKQDPSLSKGERFAATLKGISRAPSAPAPQSPSTVGYPYTQPSLFDTKKYTSVVDVGIGEQLKQSLKRLQSSFKKVDKSLSNLSKTKEENTSIKKQENTLVETLSNKFVTVSESIKENNVLKSTFNKIRSSQLNVLKKGAQVEKNAAQEAALEQGKDNSGFVKYKDPYKNQQGLIGGIIDLLVGKDDDGGGGGDCECDPEGGGPGDPGGDFDFPDIDLPGGKRRRPGTRWRWARRKFSKFGRFVKGVGSGIRGFLQRRLGGIGRFVSRNAPRALNAGKGLFGRLAGIGRGLLGRAALPLLAAGVILDTSEGERARERSLETNTPAPGDLYRPSDVLPDGTPKPGAVPYNGNKMSEGGFIPNKKESPIKKLAAGGTVPAMVGEAGPELITSPNNPMAMSAMFNPATQSIAAILGATDKVVSSAGPSAGAVKPFIQQIVGPLAKIYGKENYNFATSVGRGMANVREPDKDGGIIGFFKKLMKFVLGASEQQVDDPAVPVQSPPGAMGSGTDFWTLAAVAALEDGRAQGVADVAQSVYNRLADGSYGSSIVDILTRDGQYQVAFTDPKASSGPGTKVAPVWKSITDANSAAAAIQYYYQARGQTVSLDEARQKAENAAKALSDPTLQREAASFVQGRTDFTASASGADVVQRPGGGNAFYWAYGTGKMKGQAAAPIPSMGSPSAPPSTAPPGTAPGAPPGSPGAGALPVRAVGDSIAQGVSDASGGGVKDHATSGHNPQKVLSNLKNAGINKGNTGQVVLSTGLSNDPSMKQAVLEQMTYLQGQGIPFTVLPVSNQISQKNNNLNAWLSGATRQAGGTFASGASFSAPSSDRTEAHPSSYITMLRSVVQSSR